MRRTQLWARLREAGVPDDLCSIQQLHELPGYQETFYFLAGPGPAEMYAGVYERGEHRVALTAPEEQACEFLLQEILLTEQPPPELDAGDNLAAAQRSRELVEEVRRGLQEAARHADVTTIAFTLSPDDVVDRFGVESGSLLYPDGTPFEERSQPPTAAGPGGEPDADSYFRYQVRKPVPVRAGLVAPAFGQPGGAVMFSLDAARLPERPPLPTVRWLRRAGYLRRVL
jgi:Tuberculosis necrotizing toxin